MSTFLSSMKVKNDEWQDIDKIWSHLLKIWHSSTNRHLLSLKASSMYEYIVQCNLISLSKKWHSFCNDPKLKYIIWVYNPCNHKPIQIVILDIADQEIIVQCQTHFKYFEHLIWEIALVNIINLILILMAKLAAFELCRANKSLRSLWFS